MYFKTFLIKKNLKKSRRKRSKLRSKSESGMLTWRELREKARKAYVQKNQQ